MVSWFWTRILLCLTGIVFVACAWLFCRGKNVQLLGQFKRQTTAGRVFLAVLLLSAWIFASIKPGDGTNSPPQMASPPVSGPLQPMTFPGIATNTLHGGLRGGIVPTGGILGDGSPVIDEWSGFVPIASTNTTRVLDGDDFRRGFVMTQTGTDGSFENGKWRIKNGKCYS